MEIDFLWSVMLNHNLIGSDHFDWTDHHKMTVVGMASDHGENP